MMCAPGVASGRAGARPRATNAGEREGRARLAWGIGVGLADAAEKPARLAGKAGEAAQRARLDLTRREVRRGLEKGPEAGVSGVALQEVGRRGERRF